MKRIRYVLAGAASVLLGAAVVGTAAAQVVPVPINTCVAKYNLWARTQLSPPGYDNVIEGGSGAGVNTLINCP